MKQEIIIKRFHERTHFIENPDLVLESNSVEIIRKTYVFQEGQIEIVVIALFLV